jgi:hypothetical protein
MAAITVGRFSWDAETGTLSGPKEFMLERGNALLDQILNGQDLVFNMIAHLSPSIPVAVLAAWLGQQELLRRLP